MREGVIKGCSTHAQDESQKMSHVDLYCLGNTAKAAHSNNVASKLFTNKRKYVTHFNLVNNNKCNIISCIDSNLSDLEEHSRFDSSEEVVRRSLVGSDSNIQIGWINVVLIVLYLQIHRYQFWMQQKEFSCMYRSEIRRPDRKPPFSLIIGIG